MAIKTSIDNSKIGANLKYTIGTDEIEIVFDDEEIDEEDKEVEEKEED